MDLQNFVRETGADIGLAFDGDADRCFVVDENGEPVSPSAVTALVAARELAREPGATVIHNLITSRVCRGDRRAGGSPCAPGGALLYQGADGADRRHLGGEHSAHYYLRLLGADPACSQPCMCWPLSVGGPAVVGADG